MYYFIYTFIFCLVLPFLPLRLWWRGRKNPAYRQRWNDRFAIYKTAPLSSSIWVHAVSLGEVIAVTPLIKTLKQQYPLLPIVFTVMTPSGLTQMQKTFGNDKQIAPFYIPYDYPWAIKRFLNQINPKILLVMETELWPNMLHQCKKRGLPIFLINARLTERSFKNYYKLRWLVKKMLSNINLIIAQSKKDGDYFIKLGADPQRLIVSGNIKFDLNVAENIKERGQELRKQWGSNRLTWVAASTHQGEEEIVLAAFKKILQQMPQALLVLVPRHPERFDEVDQLCQKQGFSVARYSLKETKPPSSKTNVILGDVMGQMFLFYAASDVAFVGGSLVPIGGHNILEPAALKLPILVGPYTETLADIKSLFDEAGAVINIKNENELATKVIFLFENLSLRQKYGQSAYAIFEQNKGVINKIMEVVKAEDRGQRTDDRGLLSSQQFPSKKLL